MKTDLVFALDVGGTFVKACVIENGMIMDGTIRQFDAHANGDANEILDHFVSIILSLAKDSKGFGEKTVGIGFAFPGPFDYEKGISYIKGLNKFESLYGICLPDELLARLKTTRLGQAAKKVSLQFENDGRLFGLGASTLYPNERLICLTIGTGLGTVFIEQGEIIKNDERIPAVGYLYNQLFHGKPVDEQFSRRGILKRAADKGMDIENLDVKELADMALDGDKMAGTVFTEFGAEFAEMLVPFINRFQPDRIIIGGQIAKSFSLFGESMQQKLSNLNIKVIPLDNALRYTFIGIGQLF